MTSNRIRTRPRPTAVSQMVLASSAGDDRPRTVEPMTTTTSTQRAAIRNNQGRPSLIDMYRARTHRGTGTPGLSKARTAKQQRDLYKTPVPFSGRGVSLQVDSGRLPFTKPAEAFGWSADTPLDVWTENGRVYVTAVGDGHTIRGIVTTLGRDSRFRISAPIRASIGIDDFDNVHVVIDDTRQTVMIESVGRMLSRAYPELFEAPDAGEAA